MSVERPCVLLGVTGCIAAYKAGEIVRGLQKAGVRVKVVMTEHGTHFVDPVTFRALTHEKVAVDLFDDPSDPIHHISLAQECDVFLIAPCTANVMAKVACGIADDLLSTTALATTATLAIAPAANVHMYEAEATQENMATLRRRGVRFIEGDAVVWPIPLSSCARRWPCWQSAWAWTPCGRPVSSTVRCRSRP